MNNFVWEKPKFAAIAGTLLAVCVMFSLGAWQLHRLEWKQEKIDKLEAGAAMAPVELSSLSPENWEAYEFAKVRFSGRPLAVEPIHMAARYFRGELGYHVLVPMQIEDSQHVSDQSYRIVLVNMGWIPEKQKKTFRFGSAESWHIWQPIEGMVRIANRKGWFTPANDPEGNLWFWYDIDAMERVTGKALVPIVIDRLDTQIDSDTLEVRYPVGFTTAIKLRNDHLQYAVTWFGIGLVAIIFFVVAHLRRRES